MPLRSALHLQVILASASTAARQLIDPHHALVALLSAQQLRNAASLVPYLPTVDTSAIDPIIIIPDSQLADLAAIITVDIRQLDPICSIVIKPCVRLRLLHRRLPFVRLFEAYQLLLLLVNVDQAFVLFFVGQVVQTGRRVPPQWNLLL